MNKITLQNEVKVFGFQVKSFPTGVKEAFDELMERVPQSNERPYYGISECTPEGITYIAAALEMTEGEGDKYGYTTYVVEKGDYLAVTIMDWLTKTNSIKSVFQEMMNDSRVDSKKPAVEVYKNDDEMLCMVRMDEREDLLHEFDKTINEFMQLVSSFNEEHLNAVPYKGGWTAGQVADHISQSHLGFDQLLNGATKETERRVDEWVANIQNMFADMSIRMESPEAVWPKSDFYKKDETIKRLNDVKLSLDETIKKADLTKTCSLFELPVCGYLTRKEAIWFVIAHNQRHVRQLKR